MAEDTDVSQSGGGGTRPPDLANPVQEEIVVNGRQELEASQNEDDYRNQYIIVRSRRAKKNDVRGAGNQGGENRGRGGHNRGGFGFGNRGGGFGGGNRGGVSVSDNRGGGSMRGTRGMRGNGRGGAYAKFRKPIDIVDLDDNEGDERCEEELLGAHGGEGFVQGKDLGARSKNGDDQVSYSDKVRSKNITFSQELQRKIFEIEIELVDQNEEIKLGSRE